MYDKVFFAPWVGPYYDKPDSIFKGKVLIVGDSHYCEESVECQKPCGKRDQSTETCHTFTEEVISLYLNPECLKPEHRKWLKTFSTFINSVYGSIANQEMRQQFCDSVAFYNYLQVAAGKCPGLTNQYDYSSKTALSAFYEVMKELSPDVVISWGDKVWNALPNNWLSNNWLDNGEAQKGLDLVCDGSVFDRYLVYPFAGKHITLIGAHHPCRKYISAYHTSVYTHFGLLKNCGWLYE